MSNSLDNDFLNLYRTTKKEAETNELYNFINFSFLKIYLHTKGREKYKVNDIDFFKRLLYTLKEIFKAYNRLKRVLKGSSFNSIIVINEASHLKHAVPLKEDIKDYNPLFITNKARYIKVIADSFNTNNVVYIPITIIKAEKFRTLEIEKLLADFNISSNEVNSIAEMLNESYRNYNLTKRFIKAITKTNKIQFVYIFNDLLFSGRAIVDICNKMGIKTYYLMHGLLSDEFIENLHICDNYLVFGDYTRNILVKKEGITNEKIVTLGAPYLREQLKTKQPDFFKEEITDKLPKEKKVALILLSGPGHTVSEEHHKKILELLEELTESKQKDYHFLFKLHGKDNIDYYKNIISAKGEVYKFDHFRSKETIFDWIRAADVIITGASTTALEAMYMGKPVITIDLQGEFEDETAFIQQGATYHCRSINEVYVVMDNLLENSFTIPKESKAIVNQYFADFSHIQEFHKELLPQQVAV